MLKIIIAEDDPAMRLVLKKVLNDIPQTEVIGEVENGRQLIKMVEETPTDVIFLDVDMPEMNGVEAAREIFDVNPKIFLIFATAYDCYTHEAFAVYAFDYLIKPFNLERIRRTIKRIKSMKEERDQVSLLERRATLVGKDTQRLKIESKGRLIFINIHDIILITRNDRKTIIFTMGNVKIETYQSLQELEERLKPYRFYRCHKGFIINPDMVTELSSWGAKTYIVKLANIKETALMTFKKAKEFQERSDFI